MRVVLRECKGRRQAYPCPDTHPLIALEPFNNCEEKVRNFLPVHVLYMEEERGSILHWMSLFCQLDETELDLIEVSSQWKGVDPTQTGSQSPRTTTPLCCLEQSKFAFW